VKSTQLARKSRAEKFLNARRSLWYDSTLLVGLENLLVFLPFILISLAALIDWHMAQAMPNLKPAHAILLFDEAGNLTRCQDGHLLYVLVDYELLEKIPAAEDWPNKSEPE
jgi:hypothetical protein